MSDLLNDLLTKLSQKKTRLDSFRPLPPDLVKNLDEWFRVELTYTSNAIEGNTLSRQETALVLEKGITIGGKSLTEHLEATNHGQALEFLKNFVSKKRANLKLADLLEIHRLILQKIDDSNAGRFRSVSVRVAGSVVIFPNSARVPDLMAKFLTWLTAKNPDHPAKIAAEAHLKLVTIHPFTDGNGRTARLLATIILMQEGYTPLLVRKEDRETYIKSIEHAQLGHGNQDYYEIMYRSMLRSLDTYLEALEK